MQCYNKIFKWFTSNWWNIYYSRKFHNKIHGDQQFRFQHNRSTSDQIFCIHETLEKERRKMGKYNS